MPEPAISKYDRDTVRMDCHGLDLNRPVDSVRPGRFPILQNMRSYQQGRIGPRPGLVNNGSVLGQNIHSARRLNSGGTYTYIAGVGTVLAYGTNPYNQLTYQGQNITFSGDPLSLLPFQPEESPTSWMFVGDRNPSLSAPVAGVYGNTLKKVSINGTVNQIGLPAPTLPPSAVLSAPLYKYTSPDFDMEFANSAALQADWVADGAIAAPPTLEVRTNTTITAIIYDAAAPNWACVYPASMDQLNPGMILPVNTGGGNYEEVVVEETHPISSATTIAAILYDSGTSGLCSIVLTDPIQNIDVNSMFENSTRSEYDRVLAVTTGPSGNVSIRVRTTVTFSVGDAIQFLASFRAYFQNTHVATETLISHSAESTIEPGIGTITRTANYNLSTISANVISTADDYITISILVDILTNIQEIKLQFDCDAVENDFTQNYFYASINPSALTSAANNSQTLTTALGTAVAQQQVNQAIQNLQSQINNLEGQPGTDAQITALQNQIQVLLNSSGSGSTALAVGEAQWNQVRLKLASFIRVGTDNTRGWANIAAVQVLINTTGATTTTTFGFDDIQLGGGYGPDQSSTGAPYVYRFRAYNPSTGARSNPSPSTRGGITPYREQVTVNVPLYAYAPEATQIQIERFGGDLTNWYYAGTISNTGSPVFYDQIADDVLATNPETDIVGGQVGYGLDSFQPFPIIDVPRSGTALVVSGTTLQDNAGLFNTAWSLGTEITVGQNAYTIYRVISNLLLETFENMGSSINTPWNIAAPILVSQPLPSLWGPLNDVIFACRDSINPGRLYYLEPDSEGCTGADYYDVTPSNEPLLNGAIYNGRSYVWSNKRFFEIIQTGVSPLQYDVREIPGGKGLFSPWAFAVGPLLCWLYEDGIYASNGQAPLSITDDWLFPLFPTETQLGKSFGPVLAPNITSSNANNLRLDYAVTYLYFNYTDVNGNRGTLVYNFGSGDGTVPSGWFFDTYAVPVLFHYGEEGEEVRSILVGGNNLYQLAGNLDNNIPISCQFQTSSRDQGDDRAVKRYGDVMLDFDPQGQNITIVPGTNNFSTTYANPTIANFTGRNQLPINIQNNQWTVAKNIALNVTFFTSNTSTPLFYIWEPRSTFENAPVSAFSWEISPSSLGFPNFKSLGYGRIAGYNFTSVQFIVTIDGVTQAPISIPDTGPDYMTQVFRFPVLKGKTYGFRIASLAQFFLSGTHSYIEVKEWASNDAYTQIKPFSDYAYIQG